MSPNPTAPSMRVAPRAGLQAFFRAVEVALAIAFVMAVLLNFANVVGRYVFSRSFLGAEELQTYILVAVSFLGAAVVAWRGRELRMDVLSSRLPQGARRVVRVLEMATMTACCGFVGWQSARYALQMANLGVRSEGAGVPMWLPHGVVALGLAMIAAIAARHALRALTDDTVEAASRVLH